MKFVSTTTTACALLGAITLAGNNYFEVNAHDSVGQANGRLVTASDEATTPGRFLRSTSAMDDTTNTKARQLSAMVRQLGTHEQVGEAVRLLSKTASNFNDFEENERKLAYVAQGESGQSDARALQRGGDILEKFEDLLNDIQQVSF
eukprot:g559.t1